MQGEHKMAYSDVNVDNYCILTEIFFDVFLFVLDNEAEAETAAAFFPAQEFAAFRACIRPVVRPANQRPPWRTALAPKTASSAYNGMRTRHTAAKPTDFAECFWYFEKALFNYTFIKNKKKYFHIRCSSTFE